MLKTLLAVSCLMLSMVANAAMVTVDGIDYDVSTVTGTYNDLSATLQAQIWWGDVGLAADFAVATEEQEGTPIFAYEDYGSGIFGTKYNANANANANAPPGPAFLYPVVGYDESQVYATVTLSQVPLPAAAWLFGSGLIGLVGFARRKKA